MTITHTTTRVTQLHAELHPDLFSGISTPRLSWITETRVADWQQTHHQIKLSTLDGQVLSSTGKQQSQESHLVPWPFAPLESRAQVTVQVQVWGSDGAESEWSAPLTLETGLLHAADWTAQAIGPVQEEDPTRPGPAPLLRKTFQVKSNLRHARLYITALGVHDTQINGQPISDQLFSPGWTSYHSRLRYHTFDVTQLLHEGHNAIGSMLGNGWYRGRLGFGGGRRNLYGEKLALIAQLELCYQDGQTERITTDESWKTHSGPITFDDLYDGERYDARLEQSGWSTPNFDDAHWAAAEVLPFDASLLVAPEGPPVRRIETLQVREVIQTPSGKTVLDFGQNLVGWLRIKVQGERGHTVTLRHAEVLENGELGMRPLRYAECTDTYTLKGEGLEVFEPRFTFHGFRYAEIENWPGNFDPADLEAVVVHSDLQRTGWFECSDPLINQFHQNVVWGMRGNFLDVPTDCPQRDERLGWTGDIQAFAPTAAFLYDVRGFLTSWLKDLKADQSENGAVPAVVPQVLPATLAAAAWGDASTIVPWTLYQHCGDTGVLEQQFDSMKKWVDFQHSRAGERLIWDMDMQFGDWLDPDAPPTNPGKAKTLPGVVATAYFARSADTVARSAKVLGRVEDAACYQKLAEDVREAFQQEYVTGRGRVLSDSVTAYSLALQFALLKDETQRHTAAKRLRELVRESGYLISTGFVGTPLVCDALCSVGEVDAAYLLLTQTECPSWLYPVTMGATTIWERWDSMLPDGSINPGEMTSFNHYALGAVADWLHRSVAGLAALEPGYRKLLVRPLPGQPLSFASARHLTPYGEAAVRWEKQNGDFQLSVTVPANTTARIELPDGQVFEVGSGQHTFHCSLEQKAAQPLTMNSTFDEVIQQPGVYQRLLALVRAHSGDHVDSFKSMLRSNQQGMCLKNAVWGVPYREELLEKMQTLLQEVRA
ncbi:glycoside hydrolase family 78 protein [Deinococcus roseus]|uniref:alpha-L-rhamnosidase n=1 Tax=Deinococcus roseus TaxID=392414 RepID=A0ABQ2D3D6_9DEIO|nr:glycoside hydrolase family 78 protein [Deinococcus roseus]GGJ43019.1 alpha-L-rhamnosidase [Deinococcus roseus]